MDTSSPRTHAFQTTTSTTTAASGDAAVAHTHTQHVSPHHLQKHHHVGVLDTSTLWDPSSSSATASSSLTPSILGGQPPLNNATDAVSSEWLPPSTSLAYQPQGLGFHVSLSASFEQSFSAAEGDVVVAYEQHVAETRSTGIPATPFVSTASMTEPQLGNPFGGNVQPPLPQGQASSSPVVRVAHQGVGFGSPQVSNRQPSAFPNVIPPMQQNVTTRSPLTRGPPSDTSSTPGPHRIPPPTLSLKSLPSTQENQGPSTPTTALLVRNFGLYKPGSTPHRASLPTLDPLGAPVWPSASLPIGPMVSSLTPPPRPPAGFDPSPIHPLRAASVDATTVAFDVPGLDDAWPWNPAASYPGTTAHDDRFAFPSARREVSLGTDTYVQSQPMSFDQGNASQNPTPAPMTFASPAAAAAAAGHLRVFDDDRSPGDLAAMLALQQPPTASPRGGPSFSPAPAPAAATTAATHLDPVSSPNGVGALCSSGTLVAAPTHDPRYGSSQHRLVGLVRTPNRKHRLGSVAAVSAEGEMYEAREAAEMHSLSEFVGTVTPRRVAGRLEFAGTGFRAAPTAGSSSGGKRGGGASPANAQWEDVAASTSETAGVADLGDEEATGEDASSASKRTAFSPRAFVARETAKRGVAKKAPLVVVMPSKAGARGAKVRPVKRDGKVGVREARESSDGEASAGEGPSGAKDGATPVKVKAGANAGGTKASTPKTAPFPKEPAQEDASDGESSAGEALRDAVKPVGPTTRPSGVPKPDVPTNPLAAAPPPKPNPKPPRHTSPLPAKKPAYEYVPLRTASYRAALSLRTHLPGRQKSASLEPAHESDDTWSPSQMDESDSSDPDWEESSRPPVAARRAVATGLGERRNERGGRKEAGPSMSARENARRSLVGGLRPAGAPKLPPVPLPTSRDAPKSGNDSVSPESPSPSSIVKMEEGEEPFLPASTSRGVPHRSYKYATRAEAVANRKERNRLAAQRSRERRTKLLRDLTEENERLRVEVEELRRVVKKWQAAMEQSREVVRGGKKREKEAEKTEKRRGRGEEMPKAGSSKRRREGEEVLKARKSVEGSASGSSKKRKEPEPEEEPKAGSSKSKKDASGSHQAKRRKS
ncbi:hypothetical protein HDU96_002064 [Phlyctochytrium bullatum]|nr:hypothetical protein HDU96_002064 [Phlyctochytrium bullatum]